MIGFGLKELVLMVIKQVLHHFVDGMNITVIIQYFLIGQMLEILVNLQ